MDNPKIHIRHCLLYEYQMGHSASDAVRNICKFVGQDSISVATAYRWFERFNNGDYSLEVEPIPGRPSTIDLSELKKAINSDPTLTTRDLAGKLKCSNSTIYTHLQRLRLVSKLGQMVPHDLKPSQLKKRVDICTSLREMRRTFNWLNNLIVSDEKWVVYDNPQRKRQWLKPKELAKPTPKAGLHPKKRMLCVWWGVKGVVYWELLPEKATLTGERYCEQLRNVEAKLKETGKVQGRIWFQHDNAKPHVAKVTQAELKRLKWNVLPHPPYSPDIAPTDYHLFLSLSNNLRGKKFKNENDLKSFLENFFTNRKKGFYKRGIFDLPRRWKKVIDTDGAYILKK